MTCSHIWRGASQAAIEDGDDFRRCVECGAREPRYVCFAVRGLPVPQGSVRAFMAGGKAHVATKSAPLMAWRTAIAMVASTSMRDEPMFDEPVSVEATFTLPRPVSAPKRVVYPAVKPDIDKLARSLLDALTGVVVRDDSRVVSLTVRKRYGDPGVKVKVSEEVAI
jgi:Holliday junction resolvase RusA-like endonuclease